MYHTLKRWLAAAVAAALTAGCLNLPVLAQGVQTVDPHPANSVFQAHEWGNAQVNSAVTVNDFAPDYTSVGGSFLTGNYLRYEGVDFGEGEFNTGMLLLSALQSEAGKLIELRLDAPDGAKIGQFEVRPTQDQVTFQEQYAPVTSVNGVHDVYLVFPQDTNMNIDWFTFSTYDGTETDEQKEERMAWWNDCRFGQFIHFGAYSYLEGQYGDRIQSGHGAEWIMGDFKIPREDYEENAAKPFNPVNFDPKEIVKLAKDAGQKYLVFTSRHHEGFSMFDTQIKGFGDYKITTFGDYKGEDPVAALARECREQGIHFGVYYTIMEWHDPSQVYPAEHSNQIVSEAAKKDFVSRIKGQLRELVVDYGAEILFFDGTWNSWWNQQDGRELYRYLRTLNPDLIVNNRVGKSQPEDGDYGTPEQTIPSTGLGYDWESCMTLNNTWGYNKYDNNWKTPKTVVKNLIDCASKGGNFLLNIGPDKLGDLPEQSVSILTEAGEWLETNGESVYGTSHNCFDSLPNGMKATVKDGKVYLHVFDWKAGTSVTIPKLENKVLGARLLAGGTPVDYTVMKGGIVIDLPAITADPYDTVIELDVEGMPAVAESKDNLSLLATSVSATNYYKNDAQYAPGKAVDGNPNTRWATDDNTVQAVLELGFDEPITVNQAAISQFISSSNPNNNKINAYQIEYFKDGSWQIAYSGADMPKDAEVDFPAVTSDRFRLNLTDCRNPTLYEFELRNSEPLPEVKITSPAETTVAHRPFTVSGTCTNAGAVEVMFTGVNFSPVVHTVPVGADGSWSISVDDDIDGFIQVKAQVKNEYDEVLALDAISLNVRSKAYGENLAAGMSAETSSSYSAAYNGSKALDSDLGTRWSPINGDLNATMTIRFGERTTFDTVVLCEMFDSYNENIDYRCLAFKLEALQNGEWREIYRGTTIGEQLTAAFPAVTSDQLKLTFLECVETKNQAPPNLLEFEVYRQGSEPQPPVESDKRILGKILAYAEQAKQGSEYAGVIQEVKTSFDEAFAAAEAVYENSSSTQQEVDSAWMQLLTEIHKLGFQRGEISQLQLVYDQAAGLDLSLYVEEGQAVFLAKVDAAAALLQKPENALQSEIDETVSELLEAMLVLRLRADKTVLQAVLAKAAGIDTDAYTAESVTVFRTADHAAMAVNADENAAQAEVNEAAGNLRTAMDGLAARNVTSVQGDTALTAGSGNAKTGDAVPFAALAALLSLAGAGLISSRKKK